ncbi:hypothetical protein ACNHUS_18205 [Actinomycetes bacterium M1A6_2h]
MTHYEHLVREHRHRVERSLLAYQRAQLIESKPVVRKSKSIIRALVPAWR